MTGTSHILVQCYSAQCRGDSPQSPHSVPLSHTTDRRRGPPVTLEHLVVDAPETHYLGDSRGATSEKVEVLGRPPNHVVGRVRFLPPHPLVVTSRPQYLEDLPSLPAP